MLTMMDDPERGFTLGAAEYATKPVDRNRLLKILNKYSCAKPPCPVLLIEDDPDTRSLTRRHLESAGWTVTEVENGKVAMKSMEHERPCLILLDLMMPEMDGFEFADEVRRRPEWRTIPIIVLTALNLTDEQRQRLNGYVETILQKESDSREALLDQLLDRLAVYAAPKVSHV
jgi:CheY-like chemotaxis protein